MTIRSVCGWLLCLLLVTPASAAETVLSVESEASKVTASEGMIAWSSFDTNDSRYHLTAFVDGMARRLPVPPRQYPFDVDAGRFGKKAKVLAHTRCANDHLGRFRGLLPDWTTGRGCDVFTYTLGDERERRLRLPPSLDGSPALPAIWGDQLVVAQTKRGKRGDVRDRVRLALVGLRSGSVRWLRVGSAGTGFDEVRPTPTTMDLRDGRAAFVWDGVVTPKCFTPPDSRISSLASEVWSVSVGKAKRLARGCDRDATQGFVGVAVGPSDIFIRPVMSSLATEQFRLISPSGERRFPSPPGLVSAARVAGGAVHVRLVAGTGWMVAQTSFANH